MIIVKEIKKSSKLNNVCYDIRGPVLELAQQMEEEGQKIIKLNIGNVGVFGFDPPEEIQLDMIRNLPNSAAYSDSEGIFSARKAIMHYCQEKGIQGVTLDDIYTGNGVSELIVLAMNALLNAGDEVLVPAPDYPLWTAAVSLSGGTPKHYLCDESKDWAPDIADIKAKITPNTKAIVVINPNNPTGTFLPAKEIEALIEQVPSNVVVVIDEAYNEFLTPEQQYDAIAWVRKYPNVIVSRSFSKAYGLAGLRIGYGVAQNNITDLLNRIRQPFNVNSLAQAAAIAALADVEFLKKCYELNRAGYAQLTAAFEKMGLRYLPSSGNFVLVKVGDDVDAGAKVNLELLKAGVIVRPVGNYGLPEWLRISIGLPEENQAFIEALKKILN